MSQPDRRTGGGTAGCLTSVAVVVCAFVGSSVAAWGPLTEGGCDGGTCSIVVLVIPFLTVVVGGPLALVGGVVNGVLMRRGSGSLGIVLAVAAACAVAALVVPAVVFHSLGG